MANFPKFVALPKELRIMVWRFAITTNRPGLQRFRYIPLSSSNHYGCTHKYCQVVDSQNAILGFDSNTEWDFDDYEWPACDLSSATLGPPWLQGSARPSWIDGNNSTYLQDIGLWNACLESREVIQRHMDCCIVVTTQIDKSSGAPPTCLAWDYARDFIALQPPMDDKGNLLGKEINDHHIHYSIYRIPQFCKTNPLRKVAIEYDPKLDSFYQDDQMAELREDWAVCLLRTLLYFEGNKKTYVIIDTTEEPLSTPEASALAWFEDAKWEYFPLSQNLEEKEHFTRAQYFAEAICATVFGLDCSLGIFESCLYTPSRLGVEMHVVGRRQKLNAETR